MSKPEWAKELDRHIDTVMIMEHWYDEWASFNTYRHAAGEDIPGKKDFETARETAQQVEEKFPEYDTNVTSHQELVILEVFR